MRVFFSNPLDALYYFICTVILCLLFQIFFLRKSAKQSRVYLSIRHFLWVYVFLIYLMFVYKETGMGTLWIIGRYETLIRMEQISLIPFADIGITSGVINYFLNIVMTIPLGFLLPLIWPEFRSYKKVVLTGFAFSLLIELSQLLNLRATTIDDLVMNTLGSFIGCLIFRLLHHVIYKTRTFRPTLRSTSPIIRHEALIYIFCSFVGMFLFFNSLWEFPI